MATAKNSSKSEEFEITRAEVARMLGVSRSHVQRLTDRGILKSRQDENGTHYYDAAHIESMRERLNLGDTDQQAMLFESQNALTELALEHARLTFKPVHDATHAAMTILKEENAALRDRCNKLEGTHLELIQVVETLLSEAHARDLLTEETKARIERNKDIVSTLKNAVGPLTEQVKATIAMRQPMMRFLHTVDRDKLRALLFSGLLSEQETEALRDMLKSAGIEFETAETTAEESGEAEPATDSQSQTSE
jgi:DNA-binding transcriptional MerR regulator